MPRISNRSSSRSLFLEQTLSAAEQMVHPGLLSRSGWKALEEEETGGVSPFGAAAFSAQAVSQRFLLGYCYAATRYVLYAVYAIHITLLSLSPL